MGLIDRISDIFFDTRTPTLEEINFGTYPPLSLIQGEFDDFGIDPILMPKDKHDEFTQAAEYQMQKLKSLASQFIKENPTKKSLLSDEELASVDNTEILLAKLLDQNNGLCIGEIHNSKFMHDYLADKMEFFKSHGVEAIVIEQPIEYQAFFDESAEMLKDPKRDPTRFLQLQEALPKESKSIQKAYSEVEKAGMKYDSEGIVNMFLAAAKCGIKIICKDSSASARDKQADFALEKKSLGLRINETNFEWPKNINNIRRVYGLTDNAKILDIGGIAHYENDANGYVDEIAGFPSLALEKSSKRDGSFRIGQNVDYIIEVPPKLGLLFGFFESNEALSPTSIPNQDRASENQPFTKSAASTPPAPRP